MTKKYLCPKHREDTPSAVAYANGWYCFGCGARGELSELGIPAGERIEVTYVEDIASTIAYIKSLPRKEIRGFPLHYNSRGYYLLWPTEDYYKFRVEDADSGSKYRGPSGHKKPPFSCQSTGSLQSDRLCLVEGEFNALSLAALEPPFDVISPGGAGDFYSRGNEAHLRRYVRYGSIDLVLDGDDAGAKAAIETKVALIRSGCNHVRIHLIDVKRDIEGKKLKRDFNDVLVQGGKEALREEAKRLGLF